jgi:hypothetical protein
MYYSPRGVEPIGAASYWRAAESANRRDCARREVRELPQSNRNIGSATVS